MTRAWTPREDAVLRARYIPDGAVAVALRVSRTAVAVHHRAKRLNVLRRRRWTAREDAQLRLVWDHRALTVIAASLARPVLGVYWHAREIGLCSSAPQGLELLGHAAVRTGFDPKQIKQILQASGFALRPVTTRPGADGAARRWLVDPFDLDRAIEAWLSTEPLHSAARRSGVDDGTLERWLATDGVTRPRVGPRALGYREHWRIPTATVDRVVAANLADSRETLRESAMRVGVSYPVLSTWLKTAGVALTGKPFRLDRSDVDRVVAEHHSRATCRARRTA